MMLMRWISGFNLNIYDVSCVYITTKDENRGAYAHLYKV